MCRQFDSVLNHSIILAVVAKWLTHRIVVPTFEGSIPFNPIIVYYACSLMAKPQPSKLMLWVRFPSPAPSYYSSSSVVELSAVNRSVGFESYLRHGSWSAVKTPPFTANTGSSPVESYKQK